MEKFQNKYRILSNRWQNWDYGSNAAYFITICTSKHNCYFGNIVITKNKIMQLSESGKIAERLWLEIPNQFPFAELDAFIIMPNHVHGIIIINKTNTVQTRLSSKETRLIASLQTTNQTLSKFVGGITGNKNPMIHENLSRIIRWYKGRCSFEIHKICHDFTWQSGFYDHVIRDNNEYTAISDYINNNIEKWEPGGV